MDIADILSFSIVFTAIMQIPIIYLLCLIAIKISKK